MGGDVYEDINVNRSIVSEYSYRRYIVDYEYDKYNSLTEDEGEYFVMICGQLIAGYEREVMRKLANICV